MKLRPRSRARSFFNHGTIFFITPAALVIAFGVVAAVALLHSSSSTTGTLPNSLNQQLATEFPVLKKSMAARTTRFDKTTRMVAGREVAGLTARVEEAKGASDSGDTWAMTAALKPAQRGAWRSMAELEGGGAGELKAFYPEQFTDPFVVEGGGVSAVVRPLGAQASAATVENGQVVYRGAYAETDSLHALEAGRSEEFLYLRSKQAPRRFEYELSEVKGAREVKVEKGGVRFAGEAGPGLKIEAPWVVDSRGEKREDVVRWELGEAGADGKRRLSLVVTEEAELSYPLVIDPTWGSGVQGYVWLYPGRAFYTATLLQDGRLLLAGGWRGDTGNLKSAYNNLCQINGGGDPFYYGWPPTGDMNWARAYHTATLLPDGKVLVAGGEGFGAGENVPGYALNSAELYDPATGAWTTTGYLNTYHNDHTATLLPNGKVLVAGGYNANHLNIGNTTNIAELYDPATGAWTKTGALNTARRGHTATLLPNGMVLVAGGTGGGAALNSAELYDPATGTWTTTGPMNAARYEHTATLLPSGKVLVAGGLNGGALNSAELYDPATGTWTTTGPMNAARYEHTATLLPNGKVLIVNGFGVGGSLGNAELYDPATEACEFVPGDSGWETGGHTATLMPDGRVYIGGGYNTKYAFTFNTELMFYHAGSVYIPDEIAWTWTSNLNSRFGHTATLLPSGKVLVAAGFAGSFNSGSADLYDPVTGKWTNTGPLNTVRAYHTATLLPNGKVLVAGGTFADSNGGYGYVDSAELYDPATETWTNTGPLNTARANHTATLLPNGKVLVVGGMSGTFGNALNTAELYDPATGAWTTIGPMNTARVYHTATLLPNGKVLVAGGKVAGGYLNSAELYDPATGAWTTIGPMNATRAYHTATLLPSGKVLVAAGQGNAGYLNSAELYDPATGAWTLTGSMNAARRDHTATLLLDGRVLIAGGQGGGDLNSAELYDPATGKWTPTGPLNTIRTYHTATLLADGRVLVAGGRWGDAGHTAELFDPVVRRWTNSSPLNTTHTNHTATLLPNGKVLVAGGTGGGAALNSAELYDPATGAWTTTGTLNTARSGHTATLLPNGKVLVAGGTGGGAALNSAELYDPATGAWTTTGPLHVARYVHTATLLPNGKVLVAGGSNASVAIDNAELYDPAAGTWTQTGTLKEARYSHTATLLPNGKVFVAGGQGNAGDLSSAELYDPAAGTWTPTNPLTTARREHTATLLANGKVLVAGGQGGGAATNGAELYDPTTGAWAMTGALKEARYSHTATLLPNGKVFVAGGQGNAGDLSSAELYDPAAGTWAAAITLNTTRTNHTATLLLNGKVLVAGGQGRGAALSSAELYDPATVVWTPSGTLNAARVQHTATLLANGKVLVAGGQGNNVNIALNSAELYDPATGAWTPTGALNTARRDHTATLLPNGMVLVTGGSNGRGDLASAHLASAELYDPATGTWTPTGSLNTARRDHTATLLPSGKVLVAGGYNVSSFVNTAELYDPAAGTWTPTGSLNTARYGHTATLLPNGKVLVAGGSNASVAIDNAELYDPATGAWTTIGPMNAARRWHTATLLPSGKVLVAAGQGNASALNSAELYDPAAGTWTPTVPPNMVRYAHTATLLPSGKVLVAAGHTSSAQLYDPATGAWTLTGRLKATRSEHTATLLPNGKVFVAGGSDDTAALNSAELCDTGLGFPSSSQPVITSATSSLQLGSKLSLTGTRFQGVSGSSSDNTQSSQTNYPVVQLLSLSDGQTRFLYSDPATNWSSTSFISRPVTDFPRGYALVTVFANGIPSDAMLIQVRSPHLTSFINLSAPTITYGDTPTTLSGKISTDTGFPTGNVSIRLNGVVQQAAIQSDGTFSSNFNTGTLSGSGSPYTIVYSYLGDATYEGTTDRSKTVTVNKATAAVALSNLTHDFDGTAKFATVTTNPAGLPVDITYSQGGSPVSSPTKAGSYDILAVINDPNYQGSATGTLVINPDTVVPTVTINQAAGQADPTFYSPLNFTVIFSEPVTNFSTGDVTFITNTAGATSAVVTGSGTTYNVVVSGMTADGIVKVSIPAGAAVDVADNPNQASTTTDDEVTYTGISHNSFVVTKTADTNDGLCDADCSLREAILATNNTPGKGTITFDLPGAGPHVIQLQTGLPAISESVDILNTSGESITVKGQGPRSYFFINIFTVNAGQTVNMSYLTISQGWGQGGGIRVYGTLNLTNSTVTDNNSPAEGGGIYNGGTLNLTDCTVSNNTSGITPDPDQGSIFSATGYGGGIYNGGTLNITNSTLSGNSAPSHLNNPSFNSSGRGGGIYNRGTLNATNSTVYGNNALTGGGIYNDGGAATLRSTIVAGNSAINVFDTDLERYVYIAPNLMGPFNSEGFNLLHFGSGEATITETANAGTNLLNVAPNLDGTLADNGGPTKTHKLNSGSPAIDKGKNFSTAATDQRGMQRLYDDPAISNAVGGDGTDIGAFEAPNDASILVTTAVDELDADSEPGSGTGTSLREAIRQANSLGGGSHIITFAPNLAGQTLTLGSAWSNASDDESTSALVVNGANVTIQGPTTAPGITLNVAPGTNLRHFFVYGSPNTSLTLSNLTLSGGSPQLSGHDNGGAVWAQGPLTVRNCTFTGNSAGEGGAIQSASGAPLLLVENSTLSGNSSSGHGAAINAAASQITFRHLTVTNNTGGGSSISLGGAATMVNTIVVGNGNDSFEMGTGGAFSAQTTNNICGAAAVPGLTNGSNGNMLDVPASRLYFGPLADNGGPTQTRAIGANSLAINGGVAIAGLTTDQRGSARSVGGVPDIGAYEEPTGNGDPDGDGLTNFQEWSIGSDPASLDSDADGYNDATEMLANTNPASASSVPPSTHVERVLGYGPARGLDLTGDFVYAFNVGTNGAVGQAGDANFTADNAPGITMSAPNQVNPWGAPSFGSTAADNVLENVYKSIRWANSADADPALRTITVDLSGLTVGRRYKLQLLFGESCCNRNFDISVEGSLVADDFKPALAQGSLSLTKAGSAFVHEFVATDTTLNIVLDASNVADPSLDRNPILNGVTLERLPEAVAPVITAVGVARTQGDSATNSVIANNISDSQQAPNTLTVMVNGQSASGANSVTSNGVTISNLVVAADGTATADVAAACNAATPGVNFTLRVTNGNSLFSEATLTVTVNTPAANHLGFGQQPANTTAGQSITPAVTVVLLNQCNAVVSSTASVTIGIGTNPAGGTIGGTTTVAAVGGTATFSNLSINKAGTGYTLSATSGSLAGATSGGFNINAAAAAGISPTTGAPQSATINAAFATAMQATVIDGSGNPVSGVTVTFTAPGSGASGKFSNNTTTTTATTNASGLATASTFTANGTAGSYNVTASINGGTPSATFSLTNNTANQTINVTTHAPASAPYNSQFTVAATSTSGLPVTYSSSGSCTNTGAIFTMTSGTGTCTVKYDQAGNDNYNSASQFTESVTAQKVTPTIMFGALTGKTYGDAPFTISATGGASGNPVTFGSLTSTVCSVSSNTVSIISAGTCTIRASQAGTGNYNAASDLDQSFTVVKANQTLTFGALANKTFGDPDFDVSATAGSGLAVSFTASGQCTVTGTTVHLTGVGTCTITASQAGDGNYNAAASVVQAFTISNSSVTITLSNLSQTYDGTAKAPTAVTTPSGLSVTFTYTQDGTPVASPTNAGAYNITATINDPNYQGSTTGILVISKATPVITWNNPANITYGTSLSSTQLNATANVGGTFVYNPPASTVLNVGTHQLSVTFTPTDTANNTTAQASASLSVDPVTAAAFNLDSASYTVNEGDGRVIITVNRTGGGAGAATVNYSTSDTAALTDCNVFNGIASSRCDYATTIGTLRFAAGEMSKVIFIPLVDDSYAEGNEGFTITLSNAVGENLGAVTSAPITITDNETVTGANPLGGTEFFIREHYIDFLGREPEPGGFAGWQNTLNNCPASGKDAQGNYCDRIEVSSGFFRSEEFQSRGYFIYRFYSTLGRIPRYAEFMPDLAKVSGFLSVEQLEANKVAFVQEFISRQEFQNRYGSLTDPTAYVDALLQTVGLQNHPSRGGWITGLTHRTMTRGQVLRELIESGELYQKYFNEAFVVMQYFGYLRRDPDIHYLEWIETMKQTNDYRMLIDGFLNSKEYRDRFGH